MSRAVRAGEVWSTFIFDGIDCADLGVYAITSGSTYTTNLEPTFSDKKTNVTAYDGQYYYGTQITGQKFTFNMFAENLSYKELNRLRNWLNPRHIGKLITSDEPYKFYYVKPVSIGAIANIPLSSVQTPEQSVLNTFVEGDLVYTGKFTISFETVGSAYGYGLSYYRDDLLYDAATKYGENYYYNRGLLYKDMSPAARWTISANASQQSIPFYNPGSAEGKPIYTITTDESFGPNSKIEIRNNTLNSSVVIDVSNLSGSITVNITDQTIIDENGMTYYGRFDGPNLSISPFENMIEIPETYVDDEDNFNYVEHVSMSVVGDRVKLDPKVLLVDENITGWYFCCNKNEGIKIIDVDIDTNELILEKPNPEDIPPAEIEDGQIIRPAGVEYVYVEVNNKMPELHTGNRNEVCTVDGKWYLFTTQWEETNLFNSKEEFRDIYGYYVPVYRVFGANILNLDDIVISTGTAIKGSSMGYFELSATLQPRYL